MRDKKVPIVNEVRGNNSHPQTNMDSFECMRLQRLRPVIASDNKWRGRPPTCWMDQVERPWLHLVSLIGAEQLKEEANAYISITPRQRRRTLSE